MGINPTSGIWLVPREVELEIDRQLAEGMAK